MRNALFDFVLVFFKHPNKIVTTEIIPFFRTGILLRDRNLLSVIATIGTHCDFCNAIIAGMT